MNKKENHFLPDNTASPKVDATRFARPRIIPVALISAALLPCYYTSSHLHRIHYACVKAAKMYSYRLV